MLLTVIELREHVQTDLADAALQRILDAEEGEIVRRYGPHTEATETLRGGDRLLFLARPATAISEVVETVGVVDTVLDAADYRLWDGGRCLERLTTGSIPSLYWAERVSVAYVPADQSAQRKLVLVQLVKLALAYSGLRSESVGGDYSATTLDYVAEREKLLQSLAPRGGALFA